MANIHIKRRHKLGCDEARERVEEVAKVLQTELNANYGWDGDTLKFKRTGATGSIDVSDDEVELNIKLGVLLSPMKGTIEQKIQKRIDEVLGRGKGTKLA